MEMRTCTNPLCKQANPQPISNFHVDRHKKDGLRSRCKSCAAESGKAYREARRELLAEKQRLYYSERGEIQRRASRDWKQRNAARNSAYMQGWHRRNKARRLEYHKHYGQRNHDRVLERSRKTRARAFGLSEYFSEKEFFAKAEEMGWKCFYCGREIDKATASRDHFIPLAKGGSDIIDNIVPCCRSCNSRKKSMDPQEFILSIR